MSSLASQTVTRGVGLAATAFMAALLSPTDFGFAAIALLCITAMNVTTGFGLGPAVLAAGKTTPFDRTAATWALCTGVAGAALLAVGASLAASLLGNAEARPYVLAIAPILILQQWSEFRVAVFDRSLKFTFTNSVRAGGAVVGAVAGVLAAWLGLGAWSIIVQAWAAQTLLTLVVTITPFGNRRPGWDWSSARSLWSYGRQLAVTDASLVIYTNVDDAIVSRIAGTASLGIYAFMYKVSNTPVYALSQAVSRLSLAVYARLGSEGPALGATYQAVLKTISWLSSAIGISLAFFGPPLMDVVYGDRWSDGYQTLRILSIYGLFRAVNATSGPLLVAIGKPRALRVVTVWQTVAMIIVIYPMVHLWSIEGAAIAVTVPMIVATLVNVGRSSRAVGLSLSGSFKSIAAPSIAVTGACLYGLYVGGGISQGAVGGMLVSLVLIVLITALGLRQEMVTIWRVFRSPSHST